MAKKKMVPRMLLYLIITVFGLIMIYPLIWMFFASFKTNNEIFGGVALLPEQWDIGGYIKGWRSSGQYTYTNYFINTFLMVIPTVFFTVVSCTLVAYGFSRFHFKGRNLLFGLMIATLMLPNSVIIIPRYILFNKLSWLNSYLPFYAPAILACYPFFIFMLVQFFRGMSYELDESACLDGCGSFRTLIYILIPLLKPALISVCIFQTMWTWNDFMNPLIYISSVKNYPLALALRMGLDVAVSADWNAIMAMALVSIIPLAVLFFLLQKYFVEGITTTGIKG